MIERDEEVGSEEELYLRMLGEYLSEDPEEIKHFKRIEIIADTTNLSLQTLGETLKELQELKLNGSIIRSIRDLGTSYKSLRVLWISRVGLKDLYGLLPMQNLEELYASYNYVKDISEIECIGKLRVLDLEANCVEDVGQLSYVTGSLKSITLAENKVAESPEYLKSLVKYGTGLETIDDVDVASIKKTLESEGDAADIRSPARVNKKRVENAGDENFIEEFKKYGVTEDIVRESIRLADDFLKTEPSQEEILRQSIKVANTKHALKDPIPESKTTMGPGARLMTASTARNPHSRRPLDYEAVSNKNQVETYSELVSNTDTVFAGNPLKAAKQKRLQAGDKLKTMGIYELIEHFKGEIKAAEDQPSDKMQDEDEPLARTVAAVKVRRPSLEVARPGSGLELGMATVRAVKVETELPPTRGAKSRLEELKAVKAPTKNIGAGVNAPKNRGIIIKRIKHIKKL
eukprot:TRINITY_DN7030_c0_g4_i1.p1 TRINITY_DN7030_c0_g4~~TRINITY_DN7030_c0_g4_i1.p1  ORF type:complete len:461 (+),score=121.00 TRINITY_DN7030_c0_g4_i1:328-1710(+)